MSAQSTTMYSAETLFEQGEDYYDQHNYAKAKDAYKKALKVLEKKHRTNTLLYYQLWVELAEIADEEADYLSAAKFMERAIAVDNDTVSAYVEKDEGAHPPYRKLSDYYAQAGLWEKAILVKQQRIERHLDRIGLPNIDFDLAFEDYMYWVQNGNYYKYAMRTIQRVQEKFGTPYYSYWLGMCYYHLRDYDKALILFNQANSTKGLAMVYAAKGDIQNALALQQKVVAEEIEEKKHAIYISGHEPLPISVSALAYYYILAGQYDNAIRCELDNVQSSSSYLNLSRAYARKCQWNEARQYALMSIQMYQQEKSNAQAFAILSDCSYRTHNSVELEKYVSQMLSISTKDLLSTLEELTYDERSKYIGDYSDLMTQQVPRYVYYTDSDSLKAAAYNAILMLKGALLSSEDGVKRVIEESKDSSLVDLWEELRSERYILSRCLEKNSTGRSLNIDSLQREINKKEDSLIVRCKEYGDITRSMKLKWTDIQKTLRPDDMAIEFLSFPINNDSIIYAALTLRKDSEVPKMTVLFEEKQLKQVSDTMYYQCEEMTELVWKPLESELKGIKNIYFSPSGALYNIGIEYLPGMESYNIHRLSSTRELVTGKKTESENNAVLYGGLDYYTSIKFLKQERTKYPNLLDDVNRSTDDISQRGAIGNLKYSKDEITQIAKEVVNAHGICILRTDSIGTEESFKALSGRGINILHLSTHGYYWTEEQAKERRTLPFLKMSVNDKLSLAAEDKALTRSGLFLAGANHALQKKKLPEDIEDGILTAKEVSRLDFRGLDLVVLSACQTGLGDISQGEGVFGLQRGFKKAGANSILMSLWRVNDEATKIFMVQFYKYLLSGQSKHQSLLLAQQYLREFKNSEGEQCFNSPQYWAAFILLDDY